MPTDFFIRKRGSELITSMVNDVFYGAAMCMVIQYFYSHARRDSLKIKLVVCLLTISATLETLFVSYGSFSTFVLSFGDMNTKGEIHFSILGKYLTIFSTAFVAQIFYATRIWSIGRRIGSRLKLLTIPVVLLACTQLGAGLAQVIVMRISVTFGELGKRTAQTTTIISVQGATTAICDIAITTSFTYILHTNRSGIRRTDSLLDRLIKYAVQRAAATSVCGILTVFLYHYAKKTYFFMLPCFVNTHLHVISVISLLITREDHREEIDRSFHVSDLVLSTRRSQDSLPVEPDTQSINGKNKRISTSLE